MKLILCRKYSKLRSICKAVVAAVVCVIFGCVVVSQVYMAVRRERVEETGGNSGAVSGYVDLEFSRMSQGEAFVLIDGEKYSDINSDKIRIGITDTSVIELYNGTGQDMHTGIDGSSEDVMIISESNDIVCSEGINYICRCVYIR